MYGKIVSKEEADKLFGPVIESKEISVKDLLELIKATEKAVMFKILDGELCILGDGRKTLLPAGKVIATDIVFGHCSKEVLLELISPNVNGIAFIEQRKDKLSITCNEQTLEWVADCPPICW